MNDINMFREIVKANKPTKIGELVIDSPSAYAIVYVYDGMGTDNKVKFLSMPLNKMLAVAKQFVR
jgi:hypothetical protein